MAKSSKSGLGRGLSSLLSASADEVVSIEDVPVRTREVVEFSDKPQPAEPTKLVPATNPSPDGIQKNEKQEEGRSGSLDAKQRVGSVVSVARQTNQAGNKEQFSKSDQQDRTKESENKSDEIPIASIQPNPAQPRTIFKEEEIEELAASIEKDGLLQPLLVRPFGDKYQIIAGERRWKACKYLGMKTIPVRIREADDDLALELALVENLQRTDLNPIEEAYGYRRLMERKGLTQSEVALVLSKGRSSIANALRLLELPEDAQQLLFEEKITAGHARAILAIPTKAGRQSLTERLIKEKLSVREAETLARLLANIPKEGGSSHREPLPQSFKTIARALREALQTNVKVKSSKGKHKIEIEFKDEDELEHLFALLSTENEDTDQDEVAEIA